MTAARGLALRAPLEPGAATGAVARFVADQGAVPGEDRFLSPEIEALVEAVSTGEIVRRAASVVALD